MARGTFSFRPRQCRGDFVIIAALALGIGATAVAFSVVHGVLLRPLPFPHPERLVMIWSASHALGIERSNISGGNFDYWKGHSKSFEGMAAFRTYEGYFQIDGGLERRLVAELTPELLPLLGVRTIVGRNFIEGDRKPGGRRAVILSNSYWKDRFDGSPDVIGKSIQVSTIDRTIIGVLPAGFSFFSAVLREEPEVYLPIEAGGSWRVQQNRVYRAIGRLRQGTPIEQASAELQVIASSLERESPRFNSGYTVRLIPLRTEMFGRWRTALWIIFAAAGSLLLVSALNASGLILLRLARKQKEIALRSALGAAPFRLLGELMSETLIIGLVAGASGCLAAFLVLRSIRSSEVISQLGLPRMNEVGLSPAAVGFAALATLAASVLGMSAAAGAMARTEVTQVLRRDDVRLAGGLPVRFTSFLVVTQVVFSVVLLDCSLFMLRDLQRLQGLPFGYDYRDVLAVRVTPLFPRDWATFWQAILDNVRRLPAVACVATSYPLPSQEYPLWAFTLGEGTLPVQQVQQLARFQDVTANYFEVMRVSPLQGRLFATRAGMWEPETMVINRTMARRFWGTESPLGRKIVLPGHPDPFTIIGVVDDASQSLFQTAPDPIGYISWPNNWAYVLVRAKASLESVTPFVVSTVRATAKGIPVDDVRTLESRIFATAVEPRVQTLLASTFAFLSLVLALIGLYATLSFLFAQRIREMGIRIALGATRTDLLSLLVFRGLHMALVGVALGTAGALVLTRILSSAVYGIGTVDLFALTLVPIVVTLLCLIASYIPARRATTIHAAELLRTQ